MFKIVFEIVLLCITYAAMQKFCDCKHILKAMTSDREFFGSWFLNLHLENGDIQKDIPGYELCLDVRSQLCGGHSLNDVASMGT